MTNSMTAFARQEISTKEVDLCWEIRSVNHRYLDFSLKIPEDYREIERLLIPLIKNKISRGKVDCQLKVSQRASPLLNQVIDKDLVHSLVASLSDIKDILPDIRQPDALEILKWPGVLKEKTSGDEGEVSQINNLVVKAFDEGISSLVEMRKAEGGKLAEFILGQLHQVEASVVALTNMVPIINQQLRQKVTKRIEEIGAQPDQGRLEQEIVFLLQKADIQEELDRLTSHIEEIRSTFGSEKPIGRRLDFLMQELNREANTIASKSVNSESSLHSVEIKVLIEQMREQIQNLE